MSLPIPMEMEKWIEQAASLTDEILERTWKWNDYNEGVRFAFLRSMEEIIALTGNPEIFRVGTANDSHKEVNRYLLRFHHVYWLLKAQLAGLEEGLANQQPAPQEWSIRQTVEHILVAEWMFYGVFRYGFHLGGKSKEWLSGKMPQAFIDKHFDVDGGFPPETFDCSLEELLLFYEQRHNDVLIGLSSLNDSDLTQPLTFWEEEPMPARFRLIRFESHLSQHLIQIQKTTHQIQNHYSELHSLIEACASAFSTLDWYMHFPEQLNMDFLEKRWNQSVHPYLFIILTSAT